jgi:hypothetical protein
MTALDTRFNAPSARPLWLVTLADLALLLVGFFVFVHASQLDRAQLASAIRQGFTHEAAAPPQATSAAPMALDRMGIGPFAIGSAALPVDAGYVARWAAGAASDGRTILAVTGAVAADPADRDSVTGSAALLASDRARAVAAALIAAGFPRDRIRLSTDPAPSRAGVTLSVGFAGNRHDPASSSNRSLK